MQAYVLITYLTGMLYGKILSNVTAVDETLITKSMQLDHIQPSQAKYRVYMIRFDDTGHRLLANSFIIHLTNPQNQDIYLYGVVFKQRGDVVMTLKVSRLRFSQDKRQYST